MYLEDSSITGGRGEEGNTPSYLLQPRLGDSQAQGWLLEDERAGMLLSWLGLCPALC